MRMGLNNIKPMIHCREFADFRAKRLILKFWNPLFGGVPLRVAKSTQKNDKASQYRILYIAFLAQTGQDRPLYANRPYKIFSFQSGLIRLLCTYERLSYV
jgi:hypothetical protein